MFRAYKSNVEPMEQQKVKKLTKAQRYHSKPAEEREVPKDGGKESGSVRKGRPLWGFVRVPQPPPSTRCLRYTRRCSYRNKSISIRKVTVQSVRSFSRPGVRSFSRYWGFKNMPGILL